MILSNKQKQALHSAARAAGMDDAQRRIIQWNVGGFYSAADATVSREGFIAVMAFYEAHRNNVLPGYTAGYWAAQDRTANPTDSMVHKATELSQRLGLTPSQLDAFIAGQHMTSGAYKCLDDLPALWLRKLIEALKTIAQRKGVA